MTGTTKALIEYLRVALYVPEAHSTQGRWPGRARWPGILQ
jgi:hypothetical protein